MACSGWHNVNWSDKCNRKYGFESIKVMLSHQVVTGFFDFLFFVDAHFLFPNSFSLHSPFWHRNFVPFEARCREAHALPAQMVFIFKIILLLPDQ